jgi:hypothetical protein
MTVLFYLIVQCYLICLTYNIELVWHLTQNNNVPPKNPWDLLSFNLLNILAVALFQIYIDLVKRSAYSP